MAKKHKVGQKVWYDGREAKITKVGLPDALGTNEGVELEIMGTRGRLMTSPLDHRLTERKGQKKPSLHSLLTKATNALEGGSEALSAGGTTSTGHPLSDVKKKLLPHMWVISKDSAGGYLVTIGDPRKPRSKIVHRFSDAQDLKDWAKGRDGIGRKVSEDHVIDLSGMKLASPFWSEFYLEVAGMKKSASTKKHVSARYGETVTLTVLAKGMKRGQEVEIELDKYVDDALEEAFGDDLRRLKLDIVEAENFDDQALKEFGTRNVDPDDLVKLGELLDEHNDPDLVAAAILAADGDVNDAEDFLDRVAWVGDRNEDEDDYAYYVVEEGLMGSNLANYFDYESFGRDALMDEQNSIEMDRQIIVFYS